MKRVEINVPGDLPGIGAAVILARPSGVVWKHQAGGNACRQTKEEGVLVPLPGLDLSEEPEAREVQNRVGIGHAQADAVQRMCQRLKIPFLVAREPDKLAESCEAWVHGRIHTEGRCYDVFPAECHGMEAILLWDNSD